MELMNKQKIILTAALFVIVGIIVVAAMATPIISSMAENAKTTMHKNEGGDYTLATEHERIVVEIDGTGATATINGKKYDIYQYGSYIISDTLMMGFIPQEQAYHGIFSTNGNFRILIGSQESATVVMEEGAWSMVHNTGTTTTTYNGTYTYLYYYSGGTGNYVCGNMTSFTMNKESLIVLYSNGMNFGSSYTTTPTTAETGSATGKLYSTNGTATDITVTWTVTDNEDGTCTISNIQGINNIQKTGVAPLRYYTYDENNTTATIVGIIPILLIVMILIAASYVIMNFKSKDGGI